MATRHSITPPTPTNHLPHSDVLIAFLKVALSASERALRAADCPDVAHLVERARFNLSAAHDLVQTDRRFAA